MTTELVLTALTKTARALGWLVVAFVFVVGIIVVGSALGGLFA